LADAQKVETSDFSTGRALVEEAKRVGLIRGDGQPQSRTEVIEMLQQAAAHIDSDEDLLVVGDPASDLGELQERRRQFRLQLGSLREEIRDTERLMSVASGFENEADEQRARLESIGLISEADTNQSVCPVCDSALQEPPPTVKDVRQLLKDITDQLNSVRRDNPRVQQRLAELNARRSDIEDELRNNQQAITQRIRDSERLRVQQDTFVQRAHVSGRIAFYLETAATAAGENGLSESLMRLNAQIEELEKALDPELVEERVTTALNIVGRSMTGYANELRVEHSDNPIRIDRRNLTVVADSIDGPISLTSMGSGENWVGYHIAAHLGLHELFRSRTRPVPGFLMLDQPSQVYYPPEHPPEQDEKGDLSILDDEDKAAVHRLYELLLKFANKLAPEMQLIVVDHVDIREAWFADTVVERWRGGPTLVPGSWLRP
jgi:hypothetical protein